MNRAVPRQVIKTLAQGIRSTFFDNASTNEEELQATQAILEAKQFLGKDTKCEKAMADWYNTPEQEKANDIHHLISAESSPELPLALRVYQINLAISNELQDTLFITGQEVKHLLSVLKKQKIISTIQGRFPEKITDRDIDLTINFLQTRDQTLKEGPVVCNPYMLGVALGLFTRESNPTVTQP